MSCTINSAIQSVIKENSFYDFKPSENFIYITKDLYSKNNVSMSKHNIAVSLAKHLNKEFKAQIVDVGDMFFPTNSNDSTQGVKVQYTKKQVELVDKKSEENEAYNEAEYHRRKQQIEGQYTIINGEVVPFTKPMYSLDIPSNSVINKELEKKLQSFLDFFDIKTINLEEYKKFHKAQTGEDINPAGVALLMNKLIAWQEGNLSAMTEEVSHFAIHMLKGTVLYSQLKNYIKNTKIYKENYEKYKEEYSKTLVGKELENQIDEEMMGKALRDQLLGYKHENLVKKLINDIINWLHSKFSNKGMYNKALRDIRKLVIDGQFQYFKFSSKIPSSNLQGVGKLLAENENLINALEQQIKLYSNSFLKTHSEKAKENLNKLNAAIVDNNIEKVKLEIASDIVSQVNELKEQFKNYSDPNLAKSAKILRMMYQLISSYTKEVRDEIHPDWKDEVFKTIADFTQFYNEESKKLSAAYLATFTNGAFTQEDMIKLLSSRPDVNTIMNYKLIQGMENSSDELFNLINNAFETLSSKSMAEGEKELKELFSLNKDFKDNSFIIAKDYKGNLTQYVLSPFEFGSYFHDVFSFKKETLAKFNVKKESELKGHQKILFKLYNSIHQASLSQFNEEIWGKDASEVLNKTLNNIEIKDALKKLDKLSRNELLTDSELKEFTKVKNELRIQDFTKLSDSGKNLINIRIKELIDEKRTEIENKYENITPEDRIEIDIELEAWKEKQGFNSLKSEFVSFNYKYMSPSNKYRSKAYDKLKNDNSELGIKKFQYLLKVTELIKKYSPETPYRLPAITKHQDEKTSNKFKTIGIGLGISSALFSGGALPFSAMLYSAINHIWNEGGALANEFKDRMKRGQSPLEAAKEMLPSFFDDRYVNSNSNNGKENIEEMFIPDMFNYELKNIFDMSTDTMNMMNQFVKAQIHKKLLQDVENMWKIVLHTSEERRFKEGVDHITTDTLKSYLELKMYNAFDKSAPSTLNTILRRLSTYTGVKLMSGKVESWIKNAISAYLSTLENPNSDTWKFVKSMSKQRFKAYEFVRRQIKVDDDKRLRNTFYKKIQLHSPIWGQQTGEDLAVLKLISDLSSKYMKGNISILDDMDENGNTPNFSEEERKKYFRDVEMEHHRSIGAYSKDSMSVLQQYMLYRLLFSYKNYAYNALVNVWGTARWDSENETFVEGAGRTVVREIGQMFTKERKTIREAYHNTRLMEKLIEDGKFDVHNFEIQQNKRFAVQMSTGLIGAYFLAYIISLIFDTDDDDDEIGQLTLYSIYRSLEEKGLSQIGLGSVVALNKGQLETNWNKLAPAISVVVNLLLDLVYRDLNWSGEDDFIIKFKQSEFKDKEYGYKPGDIKWTRDALKSIPYSPLLLTLDNEEEKKESLLDKTKRYTVKNTIKKLQK